MGEDDSAAAQLVAMCDEVGVAQVVGHLFVAEVGLGDEKVTVGC
jgi:hypothetical protein